MKRYDTKCFVHTRRVRAYIRNGWASNLISPDAIPSPAANEIQSFHPTDGWKSIRNAFTSPSEVPDFSTGNIITYFVTCTAADGLAVSDFSSVNKSTENLFLYGHVHDIELNTDGDILCVRAKCRPEMRKDRIYKLILSLSDSYNIVSAKCGCPAGVGPQATCKHVGALCYALANFCQCGQLSDFVTSTEKLKQWNRPRPKKLETMPITELGARRQVILKKARSQRPIPTLYDPRPFSIRETNLEQLRLDLLTYNHQCAMLQLLVPPISKVEHDHTYAHSSCHEQLSGSQKSLVVNTDTELKLTSAIKKHIITELTVTTIERQDIEQRTRQQSNSTLASG